MRGYSHVSCHCTGRFAGGMSFVLAMDCIGKICLDKKLVSVRGANYAKKIVQLCGVDGWTAR